MTDEKELMTEEHYTETALRQSLRIKDLETENEILKQTLVKNEERMQELEDKLSSIKKE